jgi:hypothetical protein
MTAKGQDRILDFAATGMWWEITKSTADTGGEFFEAIAESPGPNCRHSPPHTHVQRALQDIITLLGVRMDVQ